MMGESVKGALSSVAPYDTAHRRASTPPVAPRFQDGRPPTTRNQLKGTTGAYTQTSGRQVAESFHRDHSDRVSRATTARNLTQPSEGAAVQQVSSEQPTHSAMDWTSLDTGAAGEDMGCGEPTNLKPEPTEDDFSLDGMTDSLHENTNLASPVDVAPVADKAKRPRGRPRKHPLAAIPSANKVGKGRSKTGCITCRKRKKKCDEAKPRCMLTKKPLTPRRCAGCLTIAGRPQL